jgi:F-type H+-transporting ATPase subunit epsilon
MANQLRLKIVTPTRTAYDDDVEMVILRGEEGDMGILPGHENRVAILDVGPLRIKNGEDEKELAIIGGFVEVLGDRVTVLSEVAEWPDEIDKVRAEEARERAESRLLQKASDVDTQRAEAALRRALVRIEVSSYPLIRGRVDSK